MHAIGIDTHKDSLAACRVDELGTALDERIFANDPVSHRDLLAWVGTDPTVVVGIEGSASFGAAAGRFLGAAGVTVREVPPQLSRRERVRTRRAGKSDPGDALAIARVTLRETDLPPVRLLDRTRRAEGLQVFLGAETAMTALASSSVVAVSYGPEDQPIGALAVIGPMRMNYGKVMSVVDVTADTVSQLLAELGGRSSSSA